MEFWITLWKVVLFGSAGAFLLVTLYIAATSLRELLLTGGEKGSGPGS